MTRVIAVSWYAALAFAIGCADQVSGEQTTTQAIETFVPHQGRLILGFKDSDVRTFALPATVTVDARGMLSNGTVSGTAFRGLKFSSVGNGTTYQMLIADVIPPQAPERQWQYVIQQLEGKRYVPACDDPAPVVPLQDPPESPIRSYAMAGTWSAAGGFFPAANVVSFACKTAVVGKCVMWGYGLDRQWPTTTLHGAASSAGPEDMLQTCTRMARADYCGTGLPNTLDGTPIQIDTPFAPLTLDPAFPFEAAWTGAAAIRGRLSPRPVVCLSKLRWSTLPLGGTCPLTIPDPRRDGKGKFCEDMSELELEQRGAHLYSSSMFLDAGLYTYADASGLRLSTSHLLPGKVGSIPSWTIPPPAGVPFPISAEEPRFEATLFTPTLPPLVPTANLVRVASYLCATDLITTATAPAGCTELATEGWVFAPGTTERAPLRRWYDPVRKHSWTTARAPSSMLADGYLAQEVIGGVLRAAIDVNVRWGAVAAGYRYVLDVQLRTGEWVTGCSGFTPVAGQALTFTGRCQTSPLRDVNHSDILAFRVTAVSSSGPTVVSAPVLYDGYASDVYVPFAGDQTTALALRWNDLGPGVKYRVWFDTGSGFLRCEDTDQLANDTSYVHVDKCYLDGHSVPVPSIRAILVCAADQNGADKACGQAAYDGHAPAVALDLIPQ
jgi:hypothetical protein